jgi:hypothetical protein
VLFDSFVGLVPAVVVGVDPNRNNVTVRYTTSRRSALASASFPRGRVDTWSATRIVRREWVRVRGGRYVILEPPRGANPVAAAYGSWTSRFTA